GLVSGHICRPEEVDAPCTEAVTVRTREKLKFGLALISGQDLNENQKIVALLTHPAQSTSLVFHQQFSATTLRERRRNAQTAIVSGRKTMLRDVLEHIGKNYLAAKEEPFKGHPLGGFIRKDGVDEVARVIADPQLIGKGGCGVSGQWAYVPWLGLFDPAITDGAQRGFYIVYLFSADMERAYSAMHPGAACGSSHSC